MSLSAESVAIKPVKRGRPPGCGRFPATMRSDSWAIFFVSDDHFCVGNCALEDVACCARQCAIPPPMKNTLLTLIVLQAAGFIAAAVAHAAGYLQFNVLTPAGFAGALFVGAVLVFACGDYRRKPSFRVRRSGHEDAPGFELPAYIPPPDWTYQTRSN